MVIFPVTSSEIIIVLKDTLKFGPLYFSIFATLIYQTWNEIQSEVAGIYLLTIPHHKNGLINFKTLI